MPTLILALALCSPLDSEIAAASADAARLGPSGPQARYLTLYNVPEAERPALRSAVSLLVNSFSQVATIIRPVEISETLLRVDLASYVRDAKDYRVLALAWDAVAQFDPYLHLRTEVLDPTTGKRATVFTDGGWLDLKEAAKLRAATGSAAGLLRADWWVATCCRPEAYHEMAGIPKTLGEYYAARGIDPKKAGDLQAVLAANLRRSAITDKPRRVIHLLGPRGSVYVTLDAAKTTAANDPYRNPTSTVDFDAGEYIGVRVNGLHDYALFDKAGKRQNAVPAAIATDFSVHPPVEVIPMLGCVRCHAGTENAPEAGLRTFADTQREILRDPRALKVANARDAVEVASLYERQERLQRQVARDREDYAEAVEAATGLKPWAAATALGQVFARYAQEDVLAADALAELGIEPGDDPAETIRLRLAAARGEAIIALGLGKPVQRAEWELDFGEAATIARAR
jgi:hypothetical protein